MSSNIRLFKYVSSETAFEILSKGTLRFSSPLEFNDPFDVSIKALFGYDVISERMRAFDELKTLLLLPEFPEGNNCDLYLLLKATHAKLKNCSSEQRQKFLLLPNKDVWNEEELIQSYQNTLQLIKSTYEDTGIFCASSNHENYLLWAHYANKHKGVVLEFSPNLEKDSVLRLATKVNYSERRPFVYYSHSDYYQKALFKTTSDVLNTYYKEIFYTKSLEWRYEDEVRVSFPGLLSAGQKYDDIGYHNDELKGVYFGCKSDVEFNKRLLNLALLRNPHANLFQMSEDQYQYKLHTTQIIL